MFGRQSNTKTAGSSSATNFTTSGSMRPLPEKPRLITSRLNVRPSIATCVMPARDAPIPCVMEVP
jgi:hypothetical protein